MQPGIMTRRSNRNRPRIRRKAPRINNVAGGVTIECPYCHPPHQLRVDVPARCGTILELNAVQNLYQDVTCALCGKSGGTLLKIGERYRHANECSPGKVIYTVPPKASRGAALFWRLPNFLHLAWARRFGKKVVELSQDGSVTGYAWDRI